MVDIISLLYNNTLIIFIISLILFVFEIIYLYQLWLLRTPKWLINFGYRIDRFRIKREMVKALSQDDQEKMETAFIRMTLNKLSSPDLDRKLIALTEIRYYARKLSPKNTELVANYLIDTYKLEDNAELKKIVIQTICRLFRERTDIGP